MSHHLSSQNLSICSNVDFVEEDDDKSAASVAGKDDVSNKEKAKNEGAETPVRKSLPQETLIKYQEISPKSNPYQRILDQFSNRDNPDIQLTSSNPSLDPSLNANQHGMNDETETVTNQSDLEK